MLVFTIVFLQFCHVFLIWNFDNKTRNQIAFAVSKSCSVTVTENQDICYEAILEYNMSKEELGQLWSPTNISNNKWM